MTEGASLADPVLDHRGQQPRNCRFGGIVAGIVEGARQSERQRRCAGHIERQIGQHPGHQRLIDQQFAEHPAVAAVMHGFGKAGAHHAGGGQRAVEPCQRDHVEDGADALPLAAKQKAVGVGKLDLRGGVGAVAELVLQRCSRRPLRVPSSRMRGTRKQLSSSSNLCGALAGTGPASRRHPTSGRKETICDPTSR
jgi:hypothetical protein